MLSRLYQRLSNLGGNVGENRGMGREVNAPKVQPMDASLSSEHVARTAPENLLCRRCKDIDLVALLETTKTRSSADLERINDRSNNEAETLKVNLGPYQDLSFDQACPLCKLIIALLPEQPRDPEKDIFLMPARSLHRLEPEVSLVEYERERKYPNLLFLGQSYFPRAERKERLEYCHEASNAAGRATGSGIVEGMPVRQVHPLRVDVALVNRWLDHCTASHRCTCNIKSFPELEGIHLIDVYSRRVVRYPARGDRQYLCLSYVWGSNEQSIERRGSELTRLPATIKDAMTFVRSVGKRYLWVDSLCINQADGAAKQSQIAIMDRIYRGAWATIVAVFGTSVHAGLPRVNPSIPTAQQTTCVIDKTEWMTAMPTLRQQAGQSKWATRAWTYQEALLSPRCIYFTQHQVYFECNAMQCCESMDMTHSPFHNISPEERSKMIGSCTCHGGISNASGSGVFRSPLADGDKVVPKQHYRHTLDRYDDVVRTYCSRDMTFPSDALNACSSILRLMEEEWFKKGFFWGLPVDVLPCALLWSHEGTARRRPGFPSWSWIGWEGKLSRAALRSSEPSKYQPPFRAWKIENGKLWSLYEASPGTTGGYDPIYALASLLSGHPNLDFSCYSKTCSGSLLVVEGIVTHIRVEEKNLTAHPYLAPGKNTLCVTANSIDCWLSCDSTETMSNVRGARSQLTCLLIDRRYEDRVGLVYELLLLEWSEKQGKTGATARRGGWLSLGMVEGYNRPSYQEVMRGLFGDGLLCTTFLILE